MCLGAAGLLYSRSSTRLRNVFVIRVEVIWFEVIVHLSLGTFNRYFMLVCIYGTSFWVLLLLVSFERLGDS